MSNPIISGYYADPDIRYFEGRYYIYPTTDGNKWHGASFKCFSSDNLKDWTDHGEIFYITWNSKWAKDFAWAPTVGYKNGSSTDRFSKGPYGCSATATPIFFSAQ